MRLCNEGPERIINNKKLKRGFGKANDGAKCEIKNKITMFVAPYGFIGWEFKHYFL